MVRNWNAKKTFVYGILFDSKAEADFYMRLLADPDVEKVEVQPMFEIIPIYRVICRRCNGSGRLPSSKKGRAINCTLCSGKGEKMKIGAKYKADFKVYYKDGRTEIVDVKGGPASRDFSLRRKLLEKTIGQEVTVIEYNKGKWNRKR
ncbi:MULTISPECIES: DUF1064 domain-containing protein [Bacillaceae]|uniref:DUF1064 domain-containing protein n=1 Tax=Domibacillus aminovorans TaxID=29332 RepID=A0A177L0S4_9BACI|nr:MULTISPECIES: DUF1064 domain-containing protein [Bacillaceae]OAH59268.1 hypothetical protein AWH48_16140 [Domibacillus aminovorans]